MAASWLAPFPTYTSHLTFFSMKLTHTSNIKKKQITLSVDARGMTVREEANCLFKRDIF